MMLLSATCARSSRRCSRTTSASTSSAGRTSCRRDVRAELRGRGRGRDDNTGLHFNIALNYGGRAEIVDAARARDRRPACRPTTLDEERFAEYLYTAGQPDPDLLIRTSGEMRVSNFLLWQIAYAEIWVTDTLWPDFRRAICSKHRGLSEARPPLRRHRLGAGRGRRQVK